MEYRRVGRTDLDVDIVGTDNLGHLEENIDVVSRGPLPREIHERLTAMFRHLRVRVHVPGRALGHY
jgi:aryl-alcohol dehydrogenase-like predicted oxidoreductase